MLIPETQEEVVAQPSFLLFATQNPPGSQYAGRKQLSRALRNRFVELHFAPLPPEELKVNQMSRKFTFMEVKWVRNLDYGRFLVV